MQLCENICELPIVDIFQAQKILMDLYGLDGALHPLNGERDLNFKVIVNPTGTTSKFVFKIANQQESREMLECQEQVFELIAKNQSIDCSQMVVSINGNTIESITTEAGEQYLCRLTTWVDGSLFSEINPPLTPLLESLGATIASINNALTGYQHEALSRPLLWRMDRALEVTDTFKALLKSDQQRKQIEWCESLFKENVVAVADQLRRGVIHNDANDNNVIVANTSPFDQRVTGLIDYGDMVESWIVTDLAVACAYGILDKSNPMDMAADVVRGYNQVKSLQEVELEALFAMIAMRISMSVCICAYQKTLQSDNEYLSISEQPAWRTLAILQNIPANFACYVFREACGLDPVPNAGKIENWLRSYRNFASVVNLDLNKDPLLLLDASVSSPYVAAPTNEHDPEIMTKELFNAIEQNGAKAGIGRYDEYRLIYNSEDFIDFSGHQRTLHLGMDIFQPAGSPVFAPVEGIVYCVSCNDAPFDYGGCVILRHSIDQLNQPNIDFYTLYGHLDPSSINHLTSDRKVVVGEQLGLMGEPANNGLWPPHVHFQIITDILEQPDTFFGVGSHRYRNIWLAICPDPNSILGISETLINQSMSDQSRDSELLLSKRSKQLSNTLSLSYKEPILTARGQGQYLYDAYGKRYLDAVNNVPHVGHCHPRIVEAGVQAASVLATNTRYLYPQIGDYLDRLLATFPEELCVAFLVNSGSEANDLALRLAWSHSGNKDVLVVDHAYHGNLTALIDMSPYKHDGLGGKGTPDWVHKVVMPDTYRMPHEISSSQCATYYAEDVKRACAAALANGGLAAFICESILGCGGQIVLPQGYLAAAYVEVRNAGGVCIADEVQTGFGRVGSHFWAFEIQGVTPDIVTLGKPAGNGHPIGVVVTTREIAESFETGMEYFNTFGGNPVSCVIGNAVLQVIEEEGLQKNAKETGEYLIQRLKELQVKHSVIGEVRGVGLFAGIDLVNDAKLKNPASIQAAYIVERMKQEGVLISTDGPDYNVLKIKPPMVFNRSNVDYLVDKLGQILLENWAIAAQQ